MATFAAGVRQTPVSSFQFEVHTVPNGNGIIFLPQGQVGFTSVSGLSNETEMFIYKEGNDGYARALPGMTPPTQVTLTRGSDQSNFLEKWRAAVMERTQLPNPALFADLVVSMYDRRGTPNALGFDQPTGRVLVKQWRVKDAWPQNLTYGDLSANSEAHIHSLTICMTGPVEVTFPLLD